MTKKHYIQIVISGLLVLIAAVMFSYYYNTYIAPESFVIGSVQLEDYKTLPIKDYLSDDTVIFSQNINDISFSHSDSSGYYYEYYFDAKEFNGEEKDYLIYVNNYLVNDLVENAGTISGTCGLTYYDTEKQILCSSAISIDFSFYSLKSRLKVSVGPNSLGYLMNYFKTDNFIITLTENPFSMMEKENKTEGPEEIVSPEERVMLSLQSDKSISVMYKKVVTDYSVSGGWVAPTEVAVLEVKSKDSISVSASGSITCKVYTDGSYTTDLTSNPGYLTINWENVKEYLIIELTVSKNVSSM